MRISSYLQTLKSFNQQDVWEMCRRSFRGTIPLLPVIQSLSGLIVTMRPSTFFNDRFGTFIFTGSKERTEQVVDHFLERRVEFIGSSEDQKKGRAMMKSRVVEAVHERIPKVTKMAADLGIQKLALGMYLPESPSPFASPQMAVGSRLLGTPMVLSVPQNMKIDASIPDPTEAQVAEFKKKDDQKKNFLFCHELMHIHKNHLLHRAVALVAFSILNTGVWTMGLRGGLHLNRLALTYGTIFGTSFLFQLFFNTLYRSQEKEADLEAIKYLKSNEGAINIFKELERLPDTLTHPPLQERLAYAGAYKN